MADLRFRFGWSKIAQLLPIQRKWNEINKSRLKSAHTDKHREKGYNEKLLSSSMS